MTFDTIFTNFFNIYYRQQSQRTIYDVFQSAFLSATVCSDLHIYSLMDTVHMYGTN